MTKAERRGDGTVFLLWCGGDSFDFQPCPYAAYCEEIEITLLRHSVRLRVSAAD